MLLVALQIHEASLCACGHPIDEAWDPDGAASYEAHKEICRACAAREAADDAEEKRPPGRKTWVSDNMRVADEVDDDYAPVFDLSGRGSLAGGDGGES